MLLKCLPQLDRWLTGRARRDLFEQIAASLMSAPTDVDAFFGNDVHYHRPERIYFARTGCVLLVTTEMAQGSTSHRMDYSIWVIGDFVRIGVLLDAQASLAPVLDERQEFTALWPGCTPELQDRAGRTLFQWSFHVPGLLDRWSARELFVDGIRHMHLRLGRIVRDGLNSQVAEGGV